MKKLLVLILTIVGINHLQAQIGGSSTCFIYPWIESVEVISEHCIPNGPGPNTLRFRVNGLISNSGGSKHWMVKTSYGNDHTFQCTGSNSLCGQGILPTCGDVNVLCGTGTTFEFDSTGCGIIEIFLGIWCSQTSTYNWKSVEYTTNNHCC